ncbi:YncE family protein [Williamsia sp. MIQD14]|uniref:YncE family protein n=1 Tax=Williamsia sp. MIQD14 TaxID=3425703 RepID=UPI003DA0049C
MRSVVLTATAAVSVVLIAACGSDTPTDRAAPSSTPVAAEPAVAPAPTTPPIGTTLEVGNEPEGVVIGTAGIAAVGVRRPDGLTLVDVRAGRVIRTVETRGAPRHLEVAGPNGPVIVPLETSNTVTEMSFDGTFGPIATGVGDLPHDAVRTSDGTLVGTNEHGGGALFLRDGKVVKSLPAGPPQPGGVAAVGRYAAMADVQGNGVFVYDGTTMTEVAQKKIGTRLTHAHALGGGLVAFADTDGGAVLVERITPQVVDVSRIDAPGKPYGLSYDDRTKTLLVTLGSTNTLRLVDMSDPSRPRVRGDVPTVQQPNSVAMDPVTGIVAVTGSAPGAASSLQLIPADLLPR